MTPFLIGIDLGTTNSALAFVDTRKKRPRVELFRIPQLVEPSVVEPRTVLPSFLYLPEPHEIESGTLSMPWQARPDVVAGTFARDHGALVPARQISSAKSWLAHPGVDRRADILPAGSESGIRLSPVAASSRYLAHLRDAWNATVAVNDDALRLEHQSITLTVPASFDEEARELTVEAARLASFTNLRLIEEPIAAFYAWIAEHRASAGAALGLGSGDAGRLALVCDVGGGTTDFSLIRVGLDGSLPSFERIAIGDHLLLGGDNMDLALAALVEERVTAAHPGSKLAITQRSALRRACSAAKERLLGDDPPESVPITVLGAGRSVVGGSMTVELGRADVERVLDVFLPMTPADDLPVARDRRAGLRELGLPYETDTAITRHLAAFLTRASRTAGAADAAVVSVAGRSMARPDFVLFNGGFFAPPAARERVGQALRTWFGQAPRVLTTGNLEAAVALGAATYGRLRVGVGAPLSLVKAGSGRAYYLGVRGRETATAVCVLARGTEEGTAARLDHAFTVATNRPVSFALRSSTTRSDRIGEIVDFEDGGDLEEHSPLVTVLRYGRKSRQVELPVRMSTAFTEVGTLELWCESETTEHRWRLQFQARDAQHEETAEAAAAAEDAEGPEGAAIVAEEAVAAAAEAIARVFGTQTASDVTAETLVAQLEKVMGFGKAAWPLGVTRRLADALIAVADGRRRSAAHEARWLNLFGFCLRPGFGAAKDPWRLGEARKIYAAGVLFPASIQNRVEWLVLWQRAAGGFSAGQQRELAQRVMGELGFGGRKAARLSPQLERESWRLLGSLERLDAATRVRIGDELMPRVRRDAGNASLLWTAGRLGARTPLYGPLSSVVPPEDAARWVEALLAVKRSTPDLAAAIVQTASLTGDPLRDLDDPIRQAAMARLREAGFADDQFRSLTEVVGASLAETTRIFGEPLPDGLRLDSSPSI